MSRQDFSSPHFSPGIVAKQRRSLQIQGARSEGDENSSFPGGTKNIPENPDLAVDTDGAAHLAWEDLTARGGYGSDGDIFYKKRMTLGDWTFPEAVSTESTGASRYPAVAIEQDGTLHMVWQDNTNYDGAGTDADIFYKFKRSGDNWTLTEVVSTESTGDSTVPGLAVDTDGNVHVVWYDETSYGGAGTDADIFYKMKTSGGIWTLTVVVSTESTGHSDHPSLGVDTGGTVHVAWRDETDYSGAGNDADIFYKMKTSGGIWTLTEVVSTESTGHSDHPSLDVDTDGKVHVAWRDTTDYSGSGSDPDIFYKSRISSGSWTLSAVISTESNSDSSDPSLGIDVDGVVHIAWEDASPLAGKALQQLHDREIAYKKSMSGGGWTFTEIVSSDSESDAFHPSIAVDTRADIHVAWEEGNDILYKKNTDNHSPLTPSPPTGPATGKSGILYTYTFSTTDPDGDQVYFKISWGDGSSSDWIGPYDTGATAQASHRWTRGGIYEVRVKARDSYGAQNNPWSDPLEVRLYGFLGENNNK